jgi:putative transposase
VSRYLARRLPRPGDAAQHWLAFLRNHREAIAALDFFTVPTITFRQLYCLFVIDHSRRKILHFNVTANPSAAWVVQQLREAFPGPAHHRYVILDRDSKLSPEVIAFLRSSGVKAVRTSCAPRGRTGWQSTGWAASGRSASTT